MSNRKTWFVLFVLVAFLFIAVLAGVGLIWLIQTPSALRAGTVLEVTLDGSTQEVPSDNPLAQLMEPSAANLWSLRQVFTEAASDDLIAAVLLEIRSPSISYAQVEEVRDFIRIFRESGKPVHSYFSGEMGSKHHLYLASPSDSITLPPESALLISGLMGQVTFFKRTLDKLFIKPDFIQFKEFKSPEVYSRERMSPEIRDMLTSILTDIQDRFVTTVAEDRGLDRSVLMHALDVGIVTPGEALEAGLVDHLGYRNDLTERLKTEVGDGEEYRSISARDYQKRISPRRSSRNRVAVLGGTGPIIAGSADPFTEMMGGSTISGHLRALREDDSIKGVIFRVNSPGGSVVGSDMILREVDALEEAGKPVVVSMSGVAGSGGYYVSMGARRIISQPSTITGSIGVIFGKFDFRGFLDYLGVDVDEIRLSPSADIFSLLSTLSPEQRRHVENWLEQIYVSFVSKAAEARGKSYDELEARARGKIYSGAQALELGLVDDLGGMSTAVAHMKEALELAEEEEVELVLYPRPKTLWEMLSSGDLFGVWSPSPADVQRLIQEKLKVLTQPAPWLLMPDIVIQ